MPVETRMSPSGRAGRKEFERSAPERREWEGRTIHPVGPFCEEAVGSPSNRGGTMTTLTDPVHVDVPERAAVQPTAPLDPPREAERPTAIDRRSTR